MTEKMSANGRVADFFSVGSKTHLKKLPSTYPVLLNLRRDFRPGVDVMITILDNFLRKKIGVFLKNQCYEQNFA
jgi:hypothetical protein